MSGWAVRDLESRELMDDPLCDSARLERTYRQFRTVNRAVSGWRRVYRTLLRPRLHRHRPTTLLDIGFGGGDIPRAIARWARRDGLRLDITAIDPDARALDHVGRLPPTAVRYEMASSADLVARGDRFDLVTSNHLLHHLEPRQLDDLLADSAALSRSLVVHNDLARARLGHAVYAAATRPLARGSFLHQDGLLSIRRSYRRDELRAVAPAPWRVTAMFPQRLLLTLEGDAG